ncbi:MAG: DinB family protein [Acidobacteriota bacterium]|nr:DinB family protein [Acidobacteriota bacterium]
MSEIATLLERFRRGPEVLAVVLTGVYGDAEDFTIAPGKWSVRQILAHLADTELVMAVRIRLVAAEENPPLTPFDQDAWARNLDYSKRKPKQSLETMRRLRAESYEQIKDLPEAAFARQGMHTERGPLTLGRIVELCANHVESHARQIEEIREAYKAAKGKK